MTQLTSDILAARQERVREALGRDRLRALVLLHLPNVRYLTGFCGSTAFAVLTQSETIFVTDGRYVTEVEQTVKSLCPGLRLVPVVSTYDGALAEIVGGLAGGRIGFEAAHLSVSRYNALVSRLERAGAGLARPAEQLVPVDRLVEAERLRKDAFEVAVFREAAAMLDTVAGGIIDSVKAGQRESEVAADIDWRLKRGGFERPSFDTIVASGPNAALPHARPGARVLQEGDLVVLDFGGVHCGYCVDMTRTVAVGELGAEARRLYEAVAAAQAAAIGAVRPGATASEVDGAARSFLEQAGLGPAFTHGTGHGLGLEIHEEPRVGPVKANAAGVQVSARDEVLAPGLVITVEPGVYLPGVGGVRIEDDVLVTAEGCEVLTQAPRAWRVV